MQHEIQRSLLETTVSFLILVLIWSVFIAGLSYGLFRAAYRGKERVSIVIGICAFVTVGLITLQHSGGGRLDQGDLAEILGGVLAAILGAAFWGKSKVKKTQPLPPSPPE
jgi:hypothetical protein